MYGTVARMRIREMDADRLAEVMTELSAGGKIPGQIATYVYQMDKDSREFYLVAVFESKEAYFANANSPEQHQRFMKLMEILESEPEWHDGEIVYTVH
jgi:quinol monooxygenase YgiN